jgi:hypothetical protein
MKCISLRRIHKVYAHEIYSCKMHAYRYTPDEIHAHEICAYKMRDTGNFFIIKPQASLYFSVRPLRCRHLV